MRKQLANPSKRKSKGQSLVELTLIITILMTLLIGMVEFSNLLNSYISIVDGAREGARLGSYTEPELSVNPGFLSVNFCKYVYWTVEGIYKDGVMTQKGGIYPVILDPATDEIIITVFSVRSNFPPGEVTVTPYYCQADVLPGAPVGARYGNKTSSFTIDQIKTRMDPLAPSSGLVLVEVFYAYHQLTGLLDFIRSEPIMVHSYSVMPLSPAEPTPTPEPGS